MFKVENLCKRYDGFELKNVSFELPRGYIIGFIGANGAGKTTTLKSMLNIVRPDGGSVTAFGMDMKEHEAEIKQKIGFASGGFECYPYEKAGKIADEYSRFFAEWDWDVYRGYLKKFGLDDKKKVREFSAGMKVKFALTLALSHNAELLILDEPTSGLDPVARDELLDIFREVVSDGVKSILFSTHITSDLDKCADYIIFIRGGEIVAFDTTDGLLDSHALVRGGRDELTEQIKQSAAGVKINEFGFSALVKKSAGADLSGLMSERPNLEDIMVYYSRGGQNND